ncbi:MAG: 5-methyltetrahydropteroyltriglutamate--homocysteine S-methyltransferase [Flavobacteriaceae bacterium]|nr:MAG: 5-methyltetrahydropteroyltriglutamate--homocysteine S-methyltransferase [Flavobacteriaceae bacterium]
MKTTNLGYPRIGDKRELKKACENYWSEQNTIHELQEVAKEIRTRNWTLQKELGIDLIPSNDFSLYDQVLDLSLTLNCIPERYNALKNKGSLIDVYFAMARGVQKNGLDITAMEMTKWFDTNYHYIVPEFARNQEFILLSTKIFDEYKEALALGIKTKPVLIGPVSYLLLGKEKEKGFHRIDLLAKLLPVYLEIIKQLCDLGVTYIQFDEPYLAMDLTQKEQKALRHVYAEIEKSFPKLKVFLATYFNDCRDNLETALSLPVHTLHIDLIRNPAQLTSILTHSNLNKNMCLSLGVVDGRNIWKNDFEQSLSLIQQAIRAIGPERIYIAPSCSLLHVPCNLEIEKNVASEVKQWLAFAKQKLEEVIVLKQLISNENIEETKNKLQENSKAIQNRNSSTLIHDVAVKQRVLALKKEDSQRNSSFKIRQSIQKSVLKLPLLPTTTIGSFPQTKEVRGWRQKFKKGILSKSEYDQLIAKETKEAIAFQEETGIDVLVHGEFERNDMVEYFGEQLSGFAFTSFGWVQSYGSRCVKPPIIYGDVSRKKPMTVRWSSFAQSLTKKLVKGMLTGPVTILQWSFVRNDQPRSATCNQIALALRDEVTDLEKAGLKIIQIDEPAIREGLPLRKNEWSSYLEWAIKAFRISASGVADETQIHTHMCYSEFNDIIQNIADMDADVITIECSRSQMELLDVFSEFNYPNEIGPGVYDIHSPRVPSKNEMLALLEKASKLIPKENLWVNPDCGLKTRHWPETKKALVEMVKSAQELRQSTQVNT